MSLWVVFRQFVLLSAAEVVYRFGQLLLTAYVARILGPSAYGLVASGQVAANYLSSLSDGGTGLHGIHSIARQPDTSPVTLRPVVEEVVGARILLGMFFYLAYAGISMLVVSFDIMPILLMTGLVGVVGIFRLDWLVKGLSSSRPLVYVNLAAIACSAVFILSMVHGQGDVLAASLLHVSALAFAAVFLTMYILWKHPGMYGITSNFRRVREVIRVSFPYSLAGLAQAGVYLAPLIMLGWYRDATQLGYYNAAYNLVFPLAGFAIYLMNSALPYLSLDLSGEGGKGQLGTMLKVAAIMGCLLGGGLALGAPLVVDLVYGPAYGSSVGVMQVLALALALQFVRQMLRGVSVIYGRGVNEIVAGLVAFLTALVLGGILIRPFGIMGTALTVCAGELVGIGVVGLGFIYRKKAVSQYEN